MIARSSSCESVAGTGSCPSPSPSTPFKVELQKWLDRYLGIPLHWLLFGGSNLRALVHAERPLDSVRCVALVKLWGLGNLAMILPYVRAVRAHFPDARIVFITLERNRSFVEHAPGIDLVWTLRDRGLFVALADIFRLVWRMRQSRVDLFLDFEQFLRLSGVLGHLGGARQAIGFDTPHQSRARLYHARVPYRDDRHMSEIFGDIVRSAGVPVESLPPFSVPRQRESRLRAAQLLELAGHRPAIVLHPGSGDNFPGRRWPLQRFATTAIALHRETHGTILLSGTSPEAPLTLFLKLELARARVPCVDLTGGMDAETLVEVLARVDLLISNDTGPVHLASALGTPVIALYGPNTPRLYGPLGENSRAIYHPLPCSPCLSNFTGKSSDCRYHACILAIEVEEVLQAARELFAHAVAPRGGT